MIAFNIPAAAVATVIASLIGATLTFLVAVFTKENKTSEFRQSWIDALRSDVADFISILRFIATDLAVIAKEGNSGISTRDYGQSMKSELIKLEMLEARIILRLNPEEHSEIIGKISCLSKIHELELLDFNKREKQIEDLIAAFQRVLKSEWKRVKSGELTYRIVRWVGLTGAMIAFGLVVAVIWSHAQDYQIVPATNQSRSESIIRTR